MSTARRAVVGLVLLLAFVVVAAAAYLRPIAPIATGYAAKTVCSGHFVSGRAVAAVAADLPDNPLVPFLRTTADTSRGTVRSTLLGLAGSTAWFTPGHGCTLADARPQLAPRQPSEPLPPDEPWPVGDAAPSGRDEETDRGLARALDPAFAEGDPQGRVRGTRAVVVVHDGELVAERYADGFDAHTPLLGWSMTKSVASTIVGRLVADEQLGLDDDRLRPEWTDERADITVEHLLRMSSGLAFAEVYDPGTDATRMLFTPTDTGAFAADKPLEHPPGTHWSYSSGTTNILCDAAQEAHGSGVDLAHDLVFDPLDMRSAVLEPDASGGLVCSSFMYATARDWARFGQLHLDDGVWEGERLLPEGWVREATRATGPAGANGYGAQWWINERAGGPLRMPSIPADAYWASGNEGQQLVVIPSAGVVVVRLGLSTFEGLGWGLEPLLRGVLDALGETG